VPRITRSDTSKTIHERHVGALASGDNLRQLLGRARISTRWLGATSWQGRRAARISICNWSTTDEDIDRSAAAILGLVERANRHTSHP
jgi:hypothetical protein